MKVLFTGMATSHCIRPENSTFFTLLADAVAEFADVTWAVPKLDWTKKDLDKFDVVIFGFIPPTSLSANKIYGAMHALGIMFESPKLKLVMDSAQMWQYKNSVGAVKRDASMLFGNFYSKRVDYSIAKDSRKYIDKAVEHMTNSVWPKTLYPSLPWLDKAKVATILGFIPEDKLVGISLDAMLIDPEPARIGRSDAWAVESLKSTWLQPLGRLLTYPQNSTKSGRKTNDEYAMTIVRNSIGLIIPPQERKMGTWWNYRMFQAMNTSTPVSTYWQDTYKFHSSWAVLAYQIEDMTSAERQALAKEQRDSYIRATPLKSVAIKHLKETLLDSEKERK
jgi:hypothetical protein